jgi:hypothetical protein
MARVQKKGGDFNKKILCYDLINSHGLIFMKINLTSLEKAVSSLNEVLDFSNSESANY